MCRYKEILCVSLVKLYNFMLSKPNSQSICLQISLWNYWVKDFLLNFHCRELTYNVCSILNCCHSNINKCVSCSNFVNTLLVITYFFPIFFRKPSAREADYNWKPCTLETGRHVGWPIKNVNGKKMLALPSRKKHWIQILLFYSRYLLIKIFSGYNNEDLIKSTIFTNIWFKFFIINFSIFCLH